MYNVSPFPDFEDAEQVQKYIQDRRVIGVCYFILPAFSFYLLF